MTGDRPPRLVEWCVANLGPEAADRLDEIPVDCRPRPCLQRCGDCYRGPFLVVDGALQTADSHADLAAALAGREVDSP